MMYEDLKSGRERRVLVAGLMLGLQVAERLVCDAKRRAELDGRPAQALSAIAMAILVERERFLFGIAECPVDAQIDIHASTRLGKAIAAMLGAGEAFFGVGVAYLISRAVGDSLARVIALSWVFTAALRGWRAG